MAYEAMNEDDEQKQQVGFGNQAVNQNTQAENNPTLGGQQSNMVQGVAGQQAQQVQGGQSNTSTGQKNSGMGARLSNLKKYVEGNRNSGMAQGIQKRIEGIRTDVQGNINTAQTKLQGQTAEERARIAQGQNLVKGSAEGGLGVLEKGRSEQYTGVAPQPIQPAPVQTEIQEPAQPVQQAPDFSQYGQTAQERLDAFSKYRKGEASQYDIENQFDLENQAKNLQKQADLSQTESGRYQLLRDTFNRPAYTTGQQRLDQLILQGSPEQAKALAEMTNTINAPVQEQLTNLKGIKETENKAILDEAGALSTNINQGLFGGVTPATLDENNQTYLNAGGVVGEFQTGLDTKLSEAKTQLSTDFTAIQEKMAKGEALTDEDYTKLNLMKNPNLADLKTYYDKNVKATIGDQLKEGKLNDNAVNYVTSLKDAEGKPLLGIDEKEFKQIRDAQPMTSEDFRHNYQYGSVVAGDMILADGVQQFGLYPGQKYYDGGMNPDGTYNIIRAGGGVLTLPPNYVSKNTPYIEYKQKIQDKKDTLNNMVNLMVEKNPELAQSRGNLDVDYASLLKGREIGTSDINSLAKEEDYLRQQALQGLTGDQFGYLNDKAALGTYNAKDIGDLNYAKAINTARDLYSSGSPSALGKIMGRDIMTNEQKQAFQQDQRLSELRNYFNGLR